MTLSHSGLPQEQITQSAKSQKKRKKKSKPKQEKSNWAENMKSSTLLFDLEIPPGKTEESNSDESSEQFEEKPIEKNENPCNRCDAHVIVLYAALLKPDSMLG